MKFYTMLFMATLIFVAACTNGGSGAIGSVIASTENGAAYLNFDDIEYEKSLSEGKTIYLEFHANWCSVCKRQEPEVISAFRDLENENIIGFKVHYNDNEVRSEEVQLARELGVPYQYTKIIINSEGQIAKRALEYWPKNRIIAELESIAS